MENNNEKTAKRIVIEFDDGTEKVLEKGACISFNTESDDYDDMTVSFDFINFAGSELEMLVRAVLEVGIKLGMFDE